MQESENQVKSAAPKVNIGRPPMNRIGQVFGLLAVISGAPRKGYWRCRCQCGNVVDRLGSNLGSKKQSNCGCLKRTFGKLKHGHSRSRVYHTFHHMMQRCYNPKHTHFSRYGGRGIKVCDRWKGRFSSFFEDMGECPLGMTIERKDNDGDYTPENCRWATRLEQAQNRCDTVKIVFRGEALILKQWAKKLGMNHEALRGRFRHGWSVEKALTTPVMPRWEHDR